MSIKRMATMIFDGILTVFFLGMIVLMSIGVYASVKEDEPAYAPVDVRIATAPADPINDIADVEVLRAEPEVIEIEVTYVDPVDLYDVPLDEELQRFMISKAEEIGIDPAVIFAMARKESTYDPAAIGDNGNSHGLLQIQPRWNMERMERLGCNDLMDPYQNVTVAVDLLDELIEKHGDIAVALTVYNFGHYPGYVTDYATTVLQWAKDISLSATS